MQVHAIIRFIKSSTGRKKALRVIVLRYISEGRLMAKLSIMIVRARTRHFAT